MSAPYYQDESVTLYHGDAVATLAEMESGSVDCIVTSPPYYGLRDYGVDGQLGAEASPAEYVENMRALFAEARRVLADDGTLWLNLGDSYNTAGTRQGHKGGFSETGQSHAKWYGKNTSGLPGKNLLGIPWRVAFALQDDGWILRNDIIWHKPNAMPMSVKDRLTTVHEHIFVFSKSRRYWFDLDPIRAEPKMTPDDIARKARGRHAPNRLADENGFTRAGRSRPISEVMGSFDEIKGANPGDVWTIPTQPFTEAHFAVMPPALAERCVQAGCKPGGTVLDPFSGSGTTGLAAAKHGRRYVGIDLNADYLDLSLKTRLQQPSLDFASLTQEPA